MTATSAETVRNAVRSAYGKVAETSQCGCGPSCCGPSSSALASEAMGYSPEETAAVPEGSNLGLGCGNPQAIAGLKPGEVVLDLGSGAGFDCFLAARQVGNSGHVIGVDMTPAMLEKARNNASRGGYGNVEFRLGEIEHLPLADESVDVVISNCVINLSPEKAKVFAEAFRVLRPGGRLAVSDVVACAELPANVREDMALVAGCIGGASSIVEVSALLEAAGFEKIRVSPVEESKSFMRDWAPGLPVTDYLVSASIEAIRPSL